jgi:hypothetical protein
MNSDVISMIGNVSQSLASVDSLISGFGYLIGILFMITAMTKLRKIGDAKANSSSQEKMFGPIAYFVGGAALIFLPSTLTTLSNTAFGSGNILQYIQYNPYSIYNSMGIIIQTAGLIWFVRGCVLLVHGSEPGVQEGPKGLTFICAGILAMNFEYTFGILNYFMNKLLSLTGMVQSSV